MENFNSKILLQHAIKILKETPIKEHEWAIGGGTVLAYFYHDRLSKDIDIFIQDLQLLSSISPRFNEQAENAIDYDEMTNYISLTYPEGKVDFISGAQLSRFQPQKRFFAGQYVYLEDPVEIVTKKIFYRGDQAKIRDIFDLTIVAATRSQDLIETLKQYPEKVSLFYKQFHKIVNEHNFLKKIPEKNTILPYGKSYTRRIIPICKSLEEAVNNKFYKCNFSR